MRLKKIAVFGLAAALLTGCAGAEQAKSQTEERQEEETAKEEEWGVLENFTATDLEGNEVTQEALADYDLTLVNVWATFCSPCLREMPDLGEIASEYEEKGVNVIGIVSDTLTSEGTIDEEQADLARDLVKETKAEYTHLLPSQDLLGILGQIYAVPTTFFVDSEGHQVGDTYMQAMTKEEMTELIEKYLAEVQDK
ncbi:MAG: TlpA family protein disulfide reductase [Ruminococcus sp.]|jgi:thiol-disulfide isomerase/thioredoxin